MTLDFSCAARLSLRDSADYEMDAIIQKSLREELGRDVTVLTVAHRLQSIMDADRIVSGFITMV